jgi:hypothetical protein
MKDVAAACIFLATKTEECGRKLRDVTKVCRSKATGVNPDKVPDSVSLLLILTITGAYAYLLGCTGNTRLPECHSSN